MSYILKKPVVVYKKVYYDRMGNPKPAIATLRLMTGTSVNRPIDEPGKNRASKARVLKIETMSTAKQPRKLCYCAPCKRLRAEIRAFKSGRLKSARSSHDPSFRYRVGKVVRPDLGYDEMNTQCAGGIHFFRRRAEAEAY